jgi:hypothetical protein
MNVQYCRAAEPRRVWKELPWPWSNQGRRVRPCVSIAKCFDISRTEADDLHPTRNHRADSIILYRACLPIQPPRLDFQHLSPPTCAVPLTPPHHPRLHIVCHTGPLGECTIPQSESPCGLALAGSLRSQLVKASTHQNDLPVRYCPGISRQQLNRGTEPGSGNAKAEDQLIRRHPGKHNTTGRRMRIEWLRYPPWPSAS